VRSPDAARLLTRICALLARASLMLAVAGLIGVIVCVQTQVVGRYVFNDTPTWAEALALLLILYVTALGVAVGVRDGGTSASTRSSRSCRSVGSCASDWSSTRWSRCSVH
jgi:hypothetical protein